MLSGAGISELDLSADGSRVIVGKKVSADSQGNEYVHPYMHVGSAAKGVDLAPTSTSGVLYGGMTPDGSVAYFTTPDKLLSEDEDTSADLYRAAVSPSGTLDLGLVTGNSTVACNPVANGNGPHWNTTGAAANCNAVAIGGGGGVVSAGGSVYFLSPEPFGGLGTARSAEPLRGGAGWRPKLVATLEPDNPLVLDSVDASATRRTADFQVTADGAFAAFTSALPLTGTGNFGYRSVFRYDADTGQLACSSCDTTGSSDDTFAGNAALAPSGLSILEDGSVFFTTPFPLVLNDANGRADVYQATPSGEQDLISSGTGSFDAGLLTVSADGTDAFFFTHDTLAPEEDQNGQLMKIYDARVGGGFFKLPAGGSLQSVGRVPWALFAGAAAARHQELRQINGRQCPGLPEEQGQAPQPVHQEEAQEAVEEEVRQGKDEEGRPSCVRRSCFRCSQLSRWRLPWLRHRRRCRSKASKP